MINAYGFIVAAHGQFAQALKYYLEAGVVATDFFSEPVPKTIYDDTVHILCHLMKDMLTCVAYSLWSLCWPEVEGQGSILHIFYFYLLYI